MKLTSYRETLKLGKDKIGEALIPIRVRRARKRAELEMCKLDELIATTEASIHEACCEEDPKFDRIIDLQDELALLERKQSQYQKILDEMFPEPEEKKK